MKRTIAKFAFSGLLVVVACFAFVSLASAHTLTTQAQAHVQMPLQTCFEESCDHVAPPPISNCSNDLTLNTKTIYDHNGVAIGQLNLFADVTTCFAVWAGLKDTNNPGNKCFTITSLQIFETNHDKSAQGALDSIPHQMCSPGKWESTKMNGWVYDGTEYDNYAHSVVTDELGFANDTTNTATVGLCGGC